MNALAAAPGGGDEAASEALLLEYLRRLESLRDGRQAVHVRLSRLNLFCRRDPDLKQATESLAELVAVQKGQLFMLRNGDLLFFFVHDCRVLVEQEIDRICVLAAGDVDAEVDDELGAGEAFVTWFDLAGGFAALYQTVLALIAPVAAAARETSSEPVAPAVTRRPGSALTPELLGRLEAGLAQADLTSLLSRHPVCTIKGETTPEPLFVEWSVSIAQLTETMLPRFDLFAERRLFRRLTQVLDRRMLALLSKPDSILQGTDIGINLNIDSILSEDFLKFDAKLPSKLRGSVVIKCKLDDIAEDWDGFVLARRLLAARGYRLCLDGLSRWTAEMIDPAAFAADYVKLQFDSRLLMAVDVSRRWLAEISARAGAGRLILSHIETADVLDLGLAAGIRLFQGHHLDALMAESRQRQRFAQLKRRLLENT
jgi:hypothetical protein